MLRHYRNPGMKAFAAAMLLLAALSFSGCQSMVVTNAGPFSHFAGINNFSGFLRDRDAGGDIVLLSPAIDSEIPYNQLVVSWNADAPAGTFVKVEAAAGAAGTQTRFFTVAEWS